MAENTSEEHPERQFTPQSEDTSKEIAFTKDRETIDSNHETENMEVHHHSHSHGKKSWKSYIWEFVMLFLAVFSGFLAEYQLEHKIERERANELSKNFYDELKNDSITMAAKYQGRIRQENALKYLMKYFKDSSVTNVSKNFVINFIYAISFRAPSLFEPRTVVLEQLKNSGSLRYFKNDELQKLIGDLSVAISNIYDRNAIETSIRTEYTNPLFVKHYDMDFDIAVNELGGESIFKNIIIYEKSDTTIPFHFKKIKDFDAEGSINTLGYYAFNGLRGTRQIQYQKYIELNAELLKLLRKEFNLK
jgi:hypothetical protein